MKVLSWLILLLSKLPRVVLYALSDVLFFVLYYIVGYRKEMSAKNIARAFPKYTANEKKIIQKNFYRNLIDWLIETIMLYNISEKKLSEMVKCDLSLFEKAAQDGDNFYGLLGHQFNWEFVNLVFSHAEHFPSFNVFYLPQQNKFFDRLLLNIRSQYGSRLINAYSFGKEMRGFKNQQHSLGILADQRPFHPHKAYWCNFLNQATPFMTEAEKSVSLFNGKPFFAEIKKIQRGKYEVVLHEIVYDKNIAGDLTKQYVKHLEASIQRNPDNYLWTHNRWKFSFDVSYKQIDV